MYSKELLPGVRFQRNAIGDSGSYFEGPVAIEKPIPP